MQVMSPSAFAALLRLIRVRCTPDVFNPWSERDPYCDGERNGPQARRARLREHLAVSPAQILIGEASGYQGCHISGIPFTSERLLLAGVVPRVSCSGERLSTRPIPWSEPSATVVWGALQALGLAATTILWNAFPWHPHRHGDLQSNRTPTPAERAQGLAALSAVLRSAPRARVFAVGRHAQLALEQLGEARAVTVLRHPSMGGARRFCEGLREALGGASRRRDEPGAARPTAPAPRGRLRGRG
jgi:uracil-DNA glycosylase